MSIECPNCGREVKDATCTCELPTASDGVKCCYSCLADHEKEILIRSNKIKPDTYTGNFAKVIDTKPNE